MVLRRTLPSRVMVDDTSATPVSASQNIEKQASSPAVSAEAQARQAAQAAEASSRAAALAADLDDLPVGGQPQKLEETFAPTVSYAPAPVAPAAPVQPEPVVTAGAPVQPEPVAQPAASADFAKQAQDYIKQTQKGLMDEFTPKAATAGASYDPFSPAPAAASAPKPEADLQTQALEHFRHNASDVENNFTMKTGATGFDGAPLTPAATAPAAATPAPQPEPEAIAPVAEEVAPAPEPVAAPVAAEQSEPEAAEPATASTADATPSRPSNNSMKRRVREKAPRNFAFTAPAVTAAAPVAAAPVMAASANPEPVEEPSPFAPQPAQEPTNSFLPPLTDEPATLPETPWQPKPLADDPILTDPAPLPQLQPESAPEAPVGSLANQPQAAQVIEDMAAPASDLPWVNNAAEGSQSDWQVEAPAASPYGTQEGAPAPLDIYGNMGASAAPATTPGLPPYLGNGAGANAPTPELPKAGFNTPRSAAPKAGGGNAVQWGIGLVIVAVVGFGAFQLVRNDRSQERVARLTGALTETTEKLPPELGGVQANTGADVLEPEQVIAMGDVNQPGILPPPPANASEGATFQPLTPVTTSSSGAMIDFADVPASEASQKIVADSSQQMPEDLGLIAKFQQAVADEKARQSGTPNAPATPATPAAVTPAPGLTPAEKEAQNLQLQAKLEAELAAYRQTLASSETPAAAPKPSDFFKNPEQFVNGTNTTGTAQLQPPVATTAEQNAQLAPNPNNLPILPEPTTAQQPQIRQLSDFNVDAFQPEDDRVRIPKGIKPRFANTEFPEVEILSFVPGRGVIAFNRGREGVLLIGESLEGWELMSVAVDKAEFRNGRSVQYVSAE